MRAFLEAIGLYDWIALVFIIGGAWVIFYYGIWKITDNGKDMPGRDM